MTSLKFCSSIYGAIGYVTSLRCCSSFLWSDWGELAQIFVVVFMELFGVTLLKVFCS